jgi:hypothetical protein
MRFQGAVIKEQGQTFAVIVAKSHVLQNRTSISDAIRTFSPTFGGMPVVLMAQDSRGRPTYFGRPDIARFLSRTPLGAIPWKEYAIN